jgi:aquaporin Z
MLSNKLVAEFLGTLILLLAILKFGKPIHIGLALAFAAYLFGSVSGGHFNPAVSFMKHLQGALSQPDLLKYVAVQLVAAWFAVQIAKRF